MNKKFLIALHLLTGIAFADCNSCEISCSSSCESKCNDDCNNCSESNNLWQPHAFQGYSSRDIIQKRTFYNVESDREGWQGFFSSAVEYMQNFGNDCNCNNLGARPFWSGTNKMTYGTNDGQSNVDAYQFGMGDVTGQGVIQLNPKVQHVGADLMLYFTKHKNARGMFFTLKAPIGAMMIDAQLCETTAAPANNNLVVDPTHVWQLYPSTTARYQTMTEAWQSGSISDGTVNSTRQKLFVLNYGRMASCKQTVIRMADLTAVLGYKAYGSDKGFVDIGFKFTCPTGNVPMGEFILEPIFGRAGHWFVGGEVTAHYKLFECEKSGRSIDFWAQGDVGHLFSGRTPSWRSFDLKQNGLGSKYLLLQYYYPANPTTTNTTGRLPSFITQAVNITTMPVKSKFAVEGTFAAAFDFYQNNWNLMIGGEFWGRSKECLSLDCCNMIKDRIANLNDYAVLGRQISDYTVNSSLTSTDVPLYYCEPLATINKSQDAYLSDSSAPEGIVDARLSENRIPASVVDALDIAGASAKRAFTGKVFGQLGYTFKEHHYTPNISLFGGAEFNAGDGNNAVSLWSLGLQGSLNF